MTTQRRIDELKQKVEEMKERLKAELIDRSPFAFHSDAGHAWLRVPRVVLEQLNLLDEISSFSYSTSITAYLEEDYDAVIFMRAYLKAIGKDENDFQSFPMIEKYDGESSPIRSYDQYAR